MADSASIPAEARRFENSRFHALLLVLPVLTVQIRHIQQDEPILASPGRVLSQFWS